MKVSIVTISFNQARFLERAIRSVVEQDYDDIEYIVLDAGSTDGSRDIIEKYREHIARTIFEPDDGPADGLNKGFAQATGDIFGYVNSDDAFLPGTISKVVALFQATPTVDVIYGHGYIIDGDGAVQRRFYSDRMTAWRFVHDGATIMQQSTFFRREALYDAIGFNVENRICWDGELILDMFLAGCRMSLVNDFWSVFTVHEDSISGQTGDKSEVAKEYDELRRFYRAYLYEKVMGKPFEQRNVILFAVARVQKWLLNPTGTLWRTIESIGLRLDDPPL